MLSAQNLRRRFLGALTVAGVAAALPLTSTTHHAPDSVAVAVAQTDDWRPTVGQATIAQMPLGQATLGQTTLALWAAGAADHDSPVVADADAVRAFAGSLPADVAGIRPQLGNPAPTTPAAAAAYARTAAARATRDLRRQHIAAVRVAAHERAVAAHKRAVAAHKRAVAAHKRAVAAHKRAVAARKRHAAALAARTPGDIAVEWARKMLGRPYRWGSTGPSSFDCSGLTRYVWSHAGVWLTHSSGAQIGEGRRVSRGELRRGDLVFFGRYGIHHVGIYIGDGMMIDAPHSGDHVRVHSIDRYDYVGAVRPG